MSLVALRIPLVAALVGVLFAVVVVEPAQAGKRSKDKPQGASSGGQELADPSQEAYKFYQFGNQFYAQGLLQKAEESFQRALRIQPTYPEAKYMLALVHLHLNQHSAALREASEALAENPFFTECYNVRGMVHARLGNYDLALAEFQAVLGDINFPTPEVAHFNIGKVFWEQQACGDAVIHFRRALEVNPTMGKAWRLLGDCQDQMGHLGPARESYEKAIELMKDDVRPMYRLGLLCFQQGDFVCARLWFDKVRTVAPASPEAGGAREYIRQMEFR